MLAQPRVAVGALGGRLQVNESLPSHARVPSPGLPIARTHSSTINTAPQTFEARSITQSAHSTLPLGKYLPLGCIKVNLITTTFLQPAWSDAIHEWPETTLEPALHTALLSLWKAGWLKVRRLRLATPLSELWRLYILPEDEIRTAHFRNKTILRKSLEPVLQVVDVSPAAWNSGAGQDFDPMRHEPQAFDRWPTADFSSLFYLFNTLPSPAPDPRAIPERYSKLTVQALLDGKVRGLNTPLYEYQRRSAAEMIQREVAPKVHLDPRLEKRTGPTGDDFYYNGRDLMFLRNPQHFEAPKGGILAETMGLGKTLICISVILATQGCWPVVPPQYNTDRIPMARGVRSLADMAANTLSRHPIPWRRFLVDDTDNEIPACTEWMQKQRPQYEIPPSLAREQRNSAVRNPSVTIRLCNTTIVVVPKNLVQQWRSELTKHVESGALKVLVLEDGNHKLPCADEIASYDIVLFSRLRFEMEARRAEGYMEDSLIKRTRMCESPLKQLHFLRLIIDEGHNISNAGTRVASVAELTIRAERRWVVSGTPAKDLMGVEVDLVSLAQAGHQEDADSFRSSLLEQKRPFNKYQEESSGAAKALGLLASGFLKANPWTNSSAGENGARDTAKWEHYIYRHESSVAKTYSGFSHCLRRTLESLVVKTRPEDVRIELPPLTHEIVRLKPCLYDKLTANLFVLLILSNAVTSEREGRDYLFHAGSQGHLHRLIHNLRQSSFYWTGLDKENVRSTLDAIDKYLAKENTNCSKNDRDVLTQTAMAAQDILKNPLWNAATQSEDMGVFIKNWPYWPQGSKAAWAFDGCQHPMAMRLFLCGKAQKYVNLRLHCENPLEGFEESGQEWKLSLMRGAGNSSSTTGAERPKDNDGVLSASGIASMRNPDTSPKKPSATSRIMDPPSLQEEKAASKKRRRSAGKDDIELTNDGLIGSTVLTGTMSAKLSYLIDRIVSVSPTEKSLVFYDGYFIQHHISSMLELFNIKYLCYSSEINSEKKGRNLVFFNKDPRQRVMLMDVKQAAHGLNVAAASRVFFINPVCRPNIEAQAIKRAHRIGQTRPVHVETLILRGAIEEAMYDRSARMTSHEHLQAKTIEDDMGVAEIIRQARILHIDSNEMFGDNQMARLAVPQQLFGRPGRSKAAGSSLGKDLLETEEDNVYTPLPPEKRKKEKKKKKQTSEATMGSTPSTESTVSMEDTGGELFHGGRSNAEASMQAGQCSIFGNG